MARCKSCGKPVTFAETVNGKEMPIELNDQGNLVLVGHLIQHIPKGQAAPAGSQRYVSHFATCPNGPAHRKPKSLRSDGQEV